MDRTAPPSTENWLRFLLIKARAPSGAGFSVYGLFTQTKKHVLHLTAVIDTIMFDYWPAATTTTETRPGKHQSKGSHVINSSDRSSRITKESAR